MTNVEKYVGMTVEQAQTAAKMAGFEVAIEIQGGPQQLNCEYRQGRITLHVENGIVTFAFVG